MTKLNDEHLTTEQLSAFLDKELSSQEQPVVDAHLRDCQRCQQILADLRQTVALLRALPRAEVPRSFTVPARVAAVQEQPAHLHAVATPISQSRRVRQNTLQHTIRAVSALAAVLGLIFILSSFATTLPRATDHNESTPEQRSTTATGAQPGGAASPFAHPVQTPTPTPTPTPTHAAKSATEAGPLSQPVPAIVDLNGPTGHLAIGSVLLVLGILGFALTRRR